MNYDLSRFLAKLKNVVRKFIKFKLLSLLLLLLILGANSNAYAVRFSPEYHAISELIDNKKFEEAYQLFDNFDFEKEPAGYLTKARLLASGVLSGGQDICGAIVNVEKVLDLNRFDDFSRFGSTTNIINYLYGGDWASIAAFEGQPIALYIMGDRTLSNIDRTSNPLYLKDESQIYQDAYVYFYNSAKRGYIYAEGFRDSLERTIRQSFPEVDYKKLQTKMEFRQILCPVRDVTLEE